MSTNKLQRKVTKEEVQFQQIICRLLNYKEFSKLPYFKERKICTKESTKFNLVEEKKYTLEKGYILGCKLNGILLKTDTKNDDVDKKLKLEAPNIPFINEEIIDNAHRSKIMEKLVATGCVYKKKVKVYRIKKKDLSKGSMLVYGLKRDMITFNNILQYLIGNGLMEYFSDSDYRKDLKYIENYFKNTKMKPEKPNTDFFKNNILPITYYSHAILSPNRPPPIEVDFEPFKT